MNIIGDLERVAGQLYPWRSHIGVAFLLAIATGLFVAYRLGWHRSVVRFWRAFSLAAILTAVVAVPLGYYLLSPLWTRVTVVEASLPATGGREAAQPALVSSGEFQGADALHFGRGRAALTEVGRGRYVLRVEEFSVLNGPDLFMYVSPNPTGYAEDAVNLGRLKGTDGAFNYEIPPETDISMARSVVVWCRQFGVLFATATLAPAQ